MSLFHHCCCCCCRQVASVVSDSVRPHRWQPTRLTRPWDSPGTNTGVGCHLLLQCVKVKSLSRVRLLATPWTAAYQAPPSMGFSRQEYWSGVPFPSPNYSLLPNISNLLLPCIFTVPKLKSSVRPNFMKTYYVCVFSVKNRKSSCVKKK